MNDFTNQEMEDALQAIASMINRSRKAQEKFAQGTSQHTLQTNRIKALETAEALIKNELAEHRATDIVTKEALEQARAPIASLISKSEKAQQKLKQGTWQHTMLEKNLKALDIASTLAKQMEEK